MGSNTESKQPRSTRSRKTSESGNESQKVEIVIKRHQQLFDLLSDPQRMWRVLLSLFLIIVILFAGIAFVVIAIKKYYPYNVVETNLQGATTMKTEDKEVIYWLFNTADLWANSGIEVEKGDELTIRASGASYTAIHHLVDASEGNYVPADQWIGTSGQAKDDARDKARSNHRLNKYCDEGTLLMKVVPKNMATGGNNWKKEQPDSLTNGYIEIIGKERTSLRISQPGVLHFAVNDIVLTDTVLKDMYKEWIDTIFGKTTITEETKNNILSAFDRIKDSKSFKNNQNTLINNNNKVADKKSFKEKGLGLGLYPNLKNGQIYDNDYPLINELVYYKEKQFRDAWYVDNLGSFLIVGKAARV